MATCKRFRVDYAAGEWVSVCGPDYEQESEFRVVDQTTGKTVLSFLEYGDWPYMVGATHCGAAKVELSEDGLQVIVTDHDGTIKTVPIPSSP